jgi:hypothetical protein
MTISKIWLNTPLFSFLEAAYLVCGLEPQNINADHPQKVLNLARQMTDYVSKENPHYRGMKTSDFKVDIDFVHAWSDRIGETDFFKSESERDKPLTESERAKLLKQIGVLALVLAEKSNQYKKGDRPNSSRIVTTAQEVLELGDFPGQTGTGKTELSNSIRAGLKPLQADE